MGKDSSSSESSDEVEILVTVKAYPNPSQKFGEAGCFAGIDRSGKHVRLYPIPFRDLDRKQKFKKYQWIRLQVRAPRNDQRPETLRPQLDTISLVGEPLSTKRAWEDRRRVVLPTASSSLCEIQALQKETGKSLGVFKPGEILDFDWEATAKEWTPAQAEKLERKPLDFFLSSDDREMLEKIPFSFRYRFRCTDCKAKRPHHLTVVDWELAQLYRTTRAGHTLERTLELVQAKFLKELCGSEKETYFFTGNMQRHLGSFLVLGVFWPPLNQPPMRAQQGSLFG